MMEVEPEVLDRVPREDAEGMMMNIEHREALSFAAVSPKEEIVELGGEKLVVEVPYILLWMIPMVVCLMLG